MFRIMYFSVVIVILSIAKKANGAVDYIHDDGGRPDFNVGVGGAGGDLLVLNRFVSDPGGNGIETVSVNWTSIASNFPATIVIYDDPNNDGDLSDLVLLTEITVVTANRGNNSRNFTDYALPQTIVSGDFYVGAYIQNMGAADSPWGYDTTTPALNTSYFFENTTAADLLLANPGANATLQGWTESLAPAGNFQIRANGVSALPLIPEPSTALLAGFSLLLIGRRRR
jgi:hypothetical protein